MLSNVGEEKALWDTCADCSDYRDTVFHFGTRRSVRKKGLCDFYKFDGNVHVHNFIMQSVISYLVERFFHVEENRCVWTPWYTLVLI